MARLSLNRVTVLLSSGSHEIHNKPTRSGLTYDPVLFSRQDFDIVFAGMLWTFYFILHSSFIDVVKRWRNSRHFCSCSVSFNDISRVAESDTSQVSAALIPQNRRRRSRRFRCSKLQSTRRHTWWVFNCPFHPSCLTNGVVAFVGQSLTDTALAWQFNTIPQENSERRSIFYPRYFDL